MVLLPHNSKEHTLRICDSLLLNISIFGFGFNFQILVPFYEAWVQEEPVFVVKTRPFIKVIMCRKQSRGAVTDGGGATHDVTGTAPTQRCQVMSYLASPSR